MAEAKIYDATLSPDKSELAQRYSQIVEVQGSYRAVDRDDKVGIEVLVGTDAEGRVTQCGFSYRDKSIALDDELTPLTHSELGERSVAPLTADPVAVREILQLILSGDEGASFSLGEPIFAVRGTGQTPDVQVGDVEIDEHNPVTCLGEVQIDGEPNRFQLRIQREILDQHVASEEDLALVKDGGAILMRAEVWK